MTPLLAKTKEDDPSKAPRPVRLPEVAKLMDAEPISNASPNKVPDVLNEILDEPNVSAKPINRPDVEKVNVVLPTKVPPLGPTIGSEPISIWAPSNKRRVAIA